MNQIFLDALKAALQNRSASLPRELDHAEWAELMRLANIHHVLPLIFEAVCEDASFARNNAPLLAASSSATFRQITKQTRKTMEFLALEQHLQAAGLRPLVVKGIICRSLYPMPDARSSTDEDVLILPEEFEAYHAALTAFGMETSLDPEKIAYSYEVPYRKNGSSLYIELHKNLFPPESNAYGDFNRFFRDVHKRAVIEQIDGTAVWTMAPTDHLFYLICHAFKHFLHSGFGIRQVCDIILYAAAHGPRMDWNLVRKNCRAIHAEAFCAALFHIGENYLGFDPAAACVPRSWMSLPVDETLMLNDLLSSGLYGDADMSRKHSSSITLDAVAAQRQGRQARGSLIASLFPPLHALTVRFKYLEKAPWLLPAAWIHRIIGYAIETRRTDSNNAVDALKIGKERVEMMRAYGIIK